MGGCLAVGIFLGIEGDGMNSPCMGCGERSVGCHGRCSRYREYRDVIDASMRRERIREFPNLARMGIRKVQK